MEKKILYEVSILFEKSEQPFSFKPKYLWILSSNIEEAISKAKEFLRNEKISKEYKIIEVKEISEEYDYLILWKN